MACEKHSIGGGLMRCKREQCRMDWFEHDDPPPQCVDNQKPVLQARPYESRNTLMVVSD